MPDESSSESPSNDNEPAQDPQTSSAQADSNGQQADPTADVDPSEIRYTEENAPEPWMVGKTPVEVAQQAGQVVESLSNPGQQMNQSGQNVQQQRQQYQQRQAQAQQTQAAQQTISPPDPDLMYDDPERYQTQLARYMQAQNQQQLAQVAQPVLQNQARTQRQLSMQDDKVREYWQKFKPQIDQYVQQVPLAQRTKEVYDQAAKMVAADNLDSIVDEAAEKKASQMGSGTQRSGGGGPSPTSGGDEVSQFWNSGHNFVENLKAQGVTQHEFRQNIQEMGLDTEQYITQLKNDAMVTDQDHLQRQVVGADQ